MGGRGSNYSVPTSSILDDLEPANVDRKKADQGRFVGTTGDLYENPLKKPPQKLYDAFNSNFGVVDESTPYEWGDTGLHEELVPVNKLGSFQNYISEDALTSLKNANIPMDSIVEPEDGMGINGLRYKGTTYIVNGNHRALVAMSQGKKKIRVTLRDVRDK